MWRREAQLSKGAFQSNSGEKSEDFVTADWGWDKISIIFQQQQNKVYKTQNKVLMCFFTPIQSNS